MSLNITKDFDEKESTWNFKLEGDLDIYTSNDFKNQVVESFKKDKKDIEIDANDLNYVDSTGLGVLISILKLLRENGNKIYFKNVKPNIRKIFHITDLDKLFIFRGENND